MRKMLMAFALLALCPGALAGSDEYEQHASERSPAAGPPEHAGHSHSDAGPSSTQSSSSVQPPCWPNC